MPREQPDFSIKQDSLFPSILVRLTSKDQPDGIDLTDAQSVNFIMAEDFETPKVNAPVTVRDAVHGEVEYFWVAGDTDTFGMFKVEFAVDWGTGPEYFPNPGFKVIEIERRLPTA